MEKLYGEYQHGQYIAMIGQTSHHIYQTRVHDDYQVPNTATNSSKQVK